MEFFPGHPVGKSIFCLWKGGYRRLRMKNYLPQTALFQISVNQYCWHNIFPESKKLFETFLQQGMSIDLICSTLVPWLKEAVLFFNRVDSFFTLNFFAVRVRVVFTLTNRGGYVPFHHQFLLAQTIKGLIVLGGEKKYSDYKQYNFSGLKGQTKVSRKGLHFYSSRVTLVFAAADKEFIDYVMNVLFQQKELMIGMLQVVPEAVEPEEPVTVAEATKFLCISPIVVVPATLNDEMGKRFISPHHEEFSDLLYENTMLRMEAGGKYSHGQLAEYYKFQLVADKEYIDRIMATHKKFARIYPLYDSDIKYEVRGYTFPFTLYAPAPVQEFIYQNGLGCYGHKGFGMVDVAHADNAAASMQPESDYA